MTFVVVFPRDFAPTVLRLEGADQAEAEMDRARAVGDRAVLGGVRPDGSFGEAIARTGLGLCEARELWRSWTGAAR